MLLICVLLAVAFAFGCKVPLKKAPWVFYLLAVALDVLVVFAAQLDAPQWVYRSVILANGRCLFAFGLFTVVMFIGVLKDGSKAKRWLTPVRAELSIVASILAVGHMVRYINVYSPRVIASPSSLANGMLLSFVIAMLIGALLVLLAVTSITIVWWSTDSYEPPFQPPQPERSPPMTFAQSSLNRRQFVAGAAAFVAALGLGSTVALADDKKADDKAAAAEKPAVELDGPFVVGFDQDFLPYGYVGDDGQYTGFDLDLAAAVAELEGWDIQLEPIAWDAKDALLNSGQDGPASGTALPWRAARTTTRSPLPIWRTARLSSYAPTPASRSSKTWPARSS